MSGCLFLGVKLSQRNSARFASPDGLAMESPCLFICFYTYADLYGVVYVASCVLGKLAPSQVLRI